MCESLQSRFVYSFIILMSVPSNEMEYTPPIIPKTNEERFKELLVMRQQCLQKNIESAELLAKNVGRDKQRAEQAATNSDVIQLEDIPTTASDKEKTNKNEKPKLSATNWERLRGSKEAPKRLHPVDRERLMSSTLLASEAASEEYSKALRRLYASVKVSDLRQSTLEAASNRVKEEALRVEEKRDKERDAKKSAHALGDGDIFVRNSNQGFAQKILREYGSALQPS